MKINLSSLTHQFLAYNLKVKSPYVTKIRNEILAMIKKKPFNDKLIGSLFIDIQYLSSIEQDEKLDTILASIYAILNSQREKTRNAIFEKLKTNEFLVDFISFIYSNKAIVDRNRLFEYFGTKTKSLINTAYEYDLIRIYPYSYSAYIYLTDNGFKFYQHIAKNWDFNPSKETEEVNEKPFTKQEKELLAKYEFKPFWMFISGNKITRLAS